MGTSTGVSPAAYTGAASTFGPSAAALAAVFGVAAYFL
jgi:hypothetical protein